MFTFQYSPKGGDANAFSKALLKRVNDDGRIYLTQTTHEGKFVTRTTAGQFDCTREDVLGVYDVLLDLIKRLQRYIANEGLKAQHSYPAGEDTFTPNSYTSCPP